MNLKPFFPRNSIPTWICALSSTVLLLTFLSLAVHVRLGLGHWPQSMVEDYHSAAFRVHEWVLEVVAHFAIFLAIPTWPFLLLFKRFRAGVRTHIVQSVVFSVGWILIILIIKFDPTPFSHWLLF